MTGVANADEDAFDVFDGFGVGFWSIDLKTMEPYWSTQVFRILGLEEPSLRAFLDGIHPDDRPLVDQVAARAREQPGPYRAVHRYLRATELRSLSHHMQSIAGPDGAPDRLLGVVRDVTDVSALRAEVAAVVAARNAGLVASSLVHSFKNQLAIVAGHAQLAIDAVDEGRLPAREGLAAIQRAATKAVDLTRQVLALGRPPTSVRHRVEAEPLLERVGSLARPILGAANEVLIEVERGAPAVMADVDRLEQVLVDLVLNAADALPPSGGRLVLGFGVRDVERADPASGGLPAGRYGSFTVTDNGEGMDAETLRKATEPYFTTKGAGKGTGIGLPTAVRFGEELGGRLEIRSERGAGTTVELMVPVAPPLAGRPAGDRPVRVVLLGDAPGAAVTVPTLRDRGVQVVSAGSWTEVDRFVRTEPIDAVVVGRGGAGGLSSVGSVPIIETDIGDPGLTEVLSSIRRQVASEPPRTSRAGEEPVARPVELGATARREAV